MKSHIFSTSLSNRNRFHLSMLALFLFLQRTQSTTVYRKFNWKDTPRPQKIRKIKTCRITNPFFLSSISNFLVHFLRLAYGLPFSLGRIIFDVPTSDFFSLIHLSLLFIRDLCTSIDLKGFFACRHLCSMLTRARQHFVWRRQQTLTPTNNNNK